MHAAEYPQSVHDRFWAKVDKTDGCWLWTGALYRNGYGQFGAAWRESSNWLAHRFAYEALVGPIPDGLHLDHVKDRGCTSRACVNPAHLEPVPPRVNVQRGEPATKTHCVNGHPLSGENLYRGPDGRRQCRTCRRIAGARSSAKRSEAQAAYARRWRAQQRDRRTG
jgi:hypothetical protein